MADPASALGAKAGADNWRFLLTVEGCHCRPLAVAILRRLSSAAISFRDFPPDLSSQMIGPIAIARSRARKWRGRSRSAEITAGFDANSSEGHRQVNGVLSR